jgi:hypothetical protein
MCIAEKHNRRFSTVTRFWSKMKMSYSLLLIWVLFLMAGVVWVVCSRCAGGVGAVLGSFLEDSMYVVYSISNSPYQEWQARLLEFSLKEVRQPGTVIRCVSEDPHYPSRVVPDFGNGGQTIVTEDFSRHERGYMALNKAGSLKEVFKRLRLPPRAIVICVDPDMIFAKPWTPDVPPGSVVGQRWMGYSPHFCMATSDASHHQLCPKSETDAVMYPFAATAIDLQALTEDYFEASQYASEEWMVEMTALVVAFKKCRLRTSTRENIGLCGDWPHADDVDAPILHYCQPVFDHCGNEIWNKRTYRAFHEAPNPDKAANRVGQEVFRALHNYRKHHS